MTAVGRYWEYRNDSFLPASRQKLSWARPNAGSNPALSATNYLHTEVVAAHGLRVGAPSPGLGIGGAAVLIYGIVGHMATKATRATLLFHEKVVRADGSIIELIIWRLPRATGDRRHGLKYRLYYGRGGKCLVRYDNEAGKGDHRHVEGREEP